MNRTKTHDDLTVWQKAHQFVLRVYQISCKFPAEERFGLSGQIRRSAISVPANITEGSKRQYTKEFIQFLHIAKGSLGESEYYIRLARDLGYVAPHEFSELLDKSSEIGRMISGLINSLRGTKRN